jgi:hypothetical protein
MSFDVSRFTFDPSNNFLGVNLQEGRVQLDSDWNEWVSEFSRRVRAENLDTLGASSVPLQTPNAFQIAPDFSIGQGRMYVDGLLAENHGLPAGLGGAPVWDPHLAERAGNLTALPPSLSSLIIPVPPCRQRAGFISPTWTPGKGR